MINPATPEQTRISQGDYHFSWGAESLPDTRTPHLQSRKRCQKKKKKKWKMHLKKNKMEKHAARLFPTHSIDRQQGGLGRGNVKSSPGRTQISRGHSRSGAVVSGRWWQEARRSHRLISAPVLLPASPLRCSVSSDYRHYGKFAADDRPRFPAKFPIMPAELPLGFSVCINRV